MGTSFMERFVIAGVGVGLFGLGGIALTTGKDETKPTRGIPQPESLLVVKPDDLETLTGTVEGEGYLEGKYILEVKNNAGRNTYYFQTGSQIPWDDSLDRIINVGDQIQITLPKSVIKTSKQGYVPIDRENIFRIDRYVGSPK